MRRKGIPTRKGRRFGRFDEYLGIFLLSLGALALEISLTRILSLVQWYHFAFMVVGIALLGYGAGGSILSAFGSLREDPRVVPASCAACCAACVLSLAFATMLRFDPFKAGTDPFQVWVILLQYVLLGLPFLFTGICLSYLIARSPQRANSIYASDLSGAALGCIVALALMPLGGPHVVILASAAAVATACFVFSRLEGLELLGRLALVSALMLGLTAAARPGFEPPISQYKGLSAALRYPDARRAWSSWNSISRVDVVESSFIHYAPGMALGWAGPIPEQMGATVDGDNLEPITRLDGNLSALSFIDGLPSSIPYLLGARRDVLILDAGGGFDVLVALRNGARDVYASEQNPSLVRAVEDRFAEFSGGLYSRPDVHLSVTDARGYLAASNSEFDLIEIALKQDPVTASVGLYSLSESYIYTVESFREMFRHLADGGVVVVTRWLAPPPRQSARIASIMVQALEKEGVPDPSQHLASFRSYMTVTTMMKRSPFTAQELASIREECEKRRFDLVYLPGISAEETDRFNVFDNHDYYQAFRSVVDPEKRQSFLDSSFFDLSAPSDDRPFFFDFLKWSSIGELRRILGPVWNPYLEGGLLVVAVLVQGALASLLLIAGPLAVSGEIRSSVRGNARWLAYFLCLGAGYMLVEVTYLQKFILFLGQPAYAMSAVLFGMLVFSGLGSLWSGRLPRGQSVAGLAILAVAGMILLYAAMLAPVARFLLGCHVWAKFAVSILMIAPVAFLMGIPFPSGMRVLGRDSPIAIPLAYCANGCSSVIGSSATIILAGGIGFKGVLVIGACVYFVAYLCLPGNRRGR